MSGEKTEALQAVLDRMTSYQDGAEEGVVAKELDAALSDVGLELSDDERAKAVAAIEDGDGTVSASSILDD